MIVGSSASTPRVGIELDGNPHESGNTRLALKEIVEFVRTNRYKR